MKGAFVSWSDSETIDRSAPHLRPARRSPVAESPSSAAEALRCSRASGTTSSRTTSIPRSVASMSGRCPTPAQAHRPRRSDRTGARGDRAGDAVRSTIRIAAFIPPMLVYGSEYGWVLRFGRRHLPHPRRNTGSDAEAKGVRVGDALLAVSGVPLLARISGSFGTPSTPSNRAPDFGSAQSWRCSARARHRVKADRAPADRRSQQRFRFVGTPFARGRTPGKAARHGPRWWRDRVVVSRPYQWSLHLVDRRPHEAGERARGCRPRISNPVAR